MYTWIQAMEDGHGYGIQIRYGHMNGNGKILKSKMLG